MPKLIIESGADKGKSFTLSGDDVIGRLPANTIHIDDDHSSRQHSNITKGVDGYYISDMNSRNGTLVNEEKVSRLRLKEGDRITIGRTVLVYTEDDAKTSISSEQSAPVGQAVDQQFEAQPEAETMPRPTGDPVGRPSAATMPISPSGVKEISKAESQPRTGALIGGAVIQPSSQPATDTGTSPESVWRKVLLFFGLLVFFVALLLVSKWLGEKFVRYLASRHSSQTNAETPANNR
ncbi:MAG: FHA domain-containing protein [Planctomycetes bacterium]|nr:FHA domain-containing protein [Planctomycetota bacterium]